MTTWERTVPLDTPKREWANCPKCNEPRGTTQRCRNGCDTWTANNVGTKHGGDMLGVFTTRGGPRGGIAEDEK